MKTSWRHLGLAILALTTALSPALASEAAPPSAAAEPAAVPVASGPGPKAVFAELTFDAGIVIKGDSIKHAFVVRNEGTAPLSILEVRPACGCTVVDFDKTIPPGGSGNINVVVDSSNFGGPTAKSIGVLTNDPANAQVLLTVKCEVRPHIRMSPGYVRYITVQGEKPGTVEQFIWAADKFAGLEISKIESPYPYLAASFREATAEERAEQLIKNDSIDGRLWRLETTLASDAPVGALTDYVKLYTNHPQQKVITLPISGFVRPILAATPNQLDLGERTLEEPYRSAIFIRNFATESILLTGVEVTSPDLKAEIAPISDGRSYNVILTLATTAAKGALNAVVRIKTDSPRLPVLEVPVTGIVK